MRNVLDKLYLSAGIFAGICLSAMGLIILAQIVGRWFDVIIPSTEDFSGFLLAATSFMAMAYTLRSGGHIRVNLVIAHIHGKPRKLIEATMLLLAFCVVSFAAWQAVFLSYESYQFEEVSQGYIPVPLWIPQIPMGLGLVILSIALVDEFVLLVRGDIPQFLQNDDSPVEEL